VECQWSRDPQKSFKVAQSCFVESVARLKLPIYNGLGGMIFLHGNDMVLEESRKTKLIDSFSRNAGNFGWGLRLPDIEQNERTPFQESVDSSFVVEENGSSAKPRPTHQMHHSEVFSDMQSSARQTPPPVFGQGSELDRISYTKNHPQRSPKPLELVPVTLGSTESAFSGPSTLHASSTVQALPSSSHGPVGADNLQQPTEPAGIPPSECVCPHCHRVLNRPFDVKRHIQTVHGQAKPFSCDDCGATFKLGHHLRTHLLEVHRKQKPYACQLCDFKAGSRKDVKTHVADVHNEKKGVRKLVLMK